MASSSELLTAATSSFNDCHRWKTLVGPPAPAVAGRVALPPLAGRRCKAPLWHWRRAGGGAAAAAAARPAPSARLRGGCCCDYYPRH